MYSDKLQEAPPKVGIYVDRLQEAPKKVKTDVYILQETPCKVCPLIARSTLQSYNYSHKPCLMGSLNCGCEAKGKLHRAEHFRPPSLSAGAQAPVLALQNCFLVKGLRLYKFLL